MKAIHWISLTLIIAVSALLIISTGDIEPRLDERIDLNWRFIPEDDSSFHEPDYDDSDWEVVSLPHDWMIEQEVSDTNSSGRAGGFYPGGVGWYRKDLDLSACKDKEQFYLVFDGVYMNADVWVNGIHAASHAYGYIGFHVDISELVRLDTLNVIAVRSECPEMPVDRWYSGAGIYRHVKLVASQKFHFPVLHTSITTRLEEENAFANAQIVLKNNDRRSKRFKLRSDLLAPDGSLVNTINISGNIDGRTEDQLTIEHEVPNPKLWSVKTPDLYEIRTTLLSGKEVNDNIVSKFGIRDIEFNPDSGFFLNGEKVLLKGVCIHHDGGSLGAAVPDATWEYRLNALKEIGVNALRLAHNPHAPEVLDLCDRMGILVIDEMYDKWEMTWSGAKSGFNFKETYKEDLAYFIRRDMNHPSIIAWSMGNETVEQLEDPTLGIQWYSELAATTREYDSSRMISCGLHPGNVKRGHQIPSDYIHIEPLVSYNYRSDSLSAWHEKYPEIAWISSETKSTHTSRPADFGEVDYMDNSWQDLEPFVAGQFIWAGIDYLGESPRWPLKGYNNGLLKTNAEIKPFAYYTQSIYAEEPMVKITVIDQTLVDSLNNASSWQDSWAGAPVVRHWNFEESESELRLIIYTNCQEVELLINDSILNYYFTGNYEDGVIKAPVNYSPGMITAVGYYTNETGQKTMVSDSIQTALSPSMIHMDPDKTELIADGQDVVHIKTSVTDSIGVVYPTANHRIDYQVTGPARIRVIDNGDPTDHTAFNATSKRVNKGSHLLIIQSTIEPGDLIISASAKGLKPASLKLTSLPSEEKKKLE